MVLDNDEAGKHLLLDMMSALGQSMHKLLFVPMPPGIKDVNTFHCTTCHRNIEVFKKKFNTLLPIPVTLEGFNSVMQEHPDQSMVTEYNINNYIIINKI